MKKIIIGVVLLCTMGIVFSQTSTSDIRVLIEDDLIDNKEKIMQLSSGLSSSEKLSLYDAHEEDLLAPLLLNGFLGFGIGSFYQGDIVGGAIGAGGNVIGVGLVLAGYIPVLTALSDDSISTAEFENVVTQYLGFYLAGGAVFFVTKVFEIIRPVVYTNSFNNTLKESLGVSAISYYAVPSYDLERGQTEIVAVISIKL